MAVPPTSDSNTTTLSFPPQYYAKLSPSSFLSANLSSTAASPSKTAIRPNGRTTTDHRSATINTSSLTNASGSAVIRLGSTSVVCAVRAELLPVSHVHGGLPRELEEWNGPDASSSDLQGARSDADIIAELNLLVPNLELNTGCNPAHLPGNAPGTEAQSLTQRVVSLLRIADLVPLKNLLVWHQNEVRDAETTGPDANKAEAEDEPRPQYELKAIWTLYIDILYISLDGSALSAAWLSLLAALKDTRLPFAHWDPEREVILCLPDNSDSVGLPLRALPCVLNAAVFSHEEDGKSDTWVLHDADDFEESVASGEITVVVAHGKAGKVRKSGGKKDVILRLEAGGKLPGGEAMQTLFTAASARLDEWSELLQWDKGTF